MDAAKLIARIEARYSEDEEAPKDEAINEMLCTVHDRLAIRLRVEEVPEIGASLIVDAAMKSLRLMGYEGSRSESTGDGGSVSNSFVDNVLGEYEEEIKALHDTVHKAGVMFL